MSHQGNQELLEVIPVLYNWKVVGIPKKSQWISRPISVGSVLVRAFHKGLLAMCPAPPPGQFCGKKGVCVQHAFADMLASCPRHIVELDLAKAFDHLWPQLAETSMVHLGTPKPIAKLLRAAWRGPRICTVSGETAQALHPIRGAPQGDLCSPLALAATLGPWTRLIEELTCKTWLYMDDRTIKADSQQSLNNAIQKTEHFDEQIGFQNNNDKKQVFDADAHYEAALVMEHLGLRWHPTAPENLTAVRDEGARVTELTEQLRRCPGNIEMRCRLACGFYRPALDWASPLLPPGTDKQAKELFRALTHCRATWWCQGRWWAGLIEDHPRFGPALRGLYNASKLHQWQSPHLTALLNAHADALQLRIVRTDAQGMWVQHKGRPLLVPSVGQHPETMTRPFHVCNEHARHCLRIRARRLALATAQHSRLDYEGIPDIDLEASSAQTWKQWTKRLSADERFSLTVWRAGAVRSKTRLNFRSNQHNMHTECDWCDAPAASAHHYFTACPRFERIRQQLQTEFGIPPQWWSQQPRCLTKTGWITMSAAHTRPRRVRLQIAACKLGIEICKACAPDTPGSPQML